jgi:hypothetical protein
MSEMSLLSAVVRLQNLKGRKKDMKLVETPAQRIN